MKAEQADMDKVQAFMERHTVQRMDAINTDRERLYDAVEAGDDALAGHILGQIIVGIAVMNYLGDELAMVAAVKKMKEELQKKSESGEFPQA